MNAIDKGHLHIVYEINYRFNQENQNLLSSSLFQSKLNMENMTKPELLMLFSILEGELEARDLVIEALKVFMNGTGNIMR